MTQAVSSTSADASDSSAAKRTGGLEGVVAAKSDICFIDGQAGRLVYRGYEIPEVVENLSFEETAHLLWEGKLPNRTQLATLKNQLNAAMALPKHVQAILQALPPQTQPMDALRTAASALGAIDPDLSSNSPDANRRKAMRLTAEFP